MTKKIFFISLWVTSISFVMGWKVATMTNQDKMSKTVTQAIPVIRFERFDKSRNTLIIGLFNPGVMAMEINHTELLYKPANTMPQLPFNKPNYMNKPLVLDPGDTILISMQTNTASKSWRKMGSYWAKMDFKVYGQADYFSLQHKFGSALLRND